MMGGKKQRLLVLLILAGALAMMANMLNREETRAAAQERGLISITELSFPHSRQVLYRTMGESLLMYLDGELKAYSPKGQLIWTYVAEIESPLIRANEQGVALADPLNKKVVFLDREGRTRYHLSLQSQIKGMWLGQTGELLIAEEPEQNPVQNIFIYNGDGEKTGSILNGEGHLITGGLSDRENLVLVYTLQVKSGKLEGLLKEYTMKGNLLRVESVPGKLLLELEIDQKGNVLLCYDDELVFKAPSQQILWREKATGLRKIFFDQETQQVAFYQEITGKGLLWGRDKNQLHILGPDGKQMAAKEVEKNLKSGDLLKNTILLYDERSLLLLNEKGQAEVSHLFYEDIEEALLLTEEYLAVAAKERLVFYRREGK